MLYEKIMPFAGFTMLKGTSINSFWNTNTGIFSDIRRQKRSLASLNEYFGNRAKVRWTFEPACAEARKKPKLGNKMELIEVPLNETH